MKNHTNLCLHSNILPHIVVLSHLHNCSLKRRKGKKDKLGTNRNEKLKDWRGMNNGNFILKVNKNSYIIKFLSYTNR